MVTLLQWKQNAQSIYNFICWKGGGGTYDITYNCKKFSKIHENLVNASYANIY